MGGGREGGLNELLDLECGWVGGWVGGTLTNGKSAAVGFVSLDQVNNASLLIGRDSAGHY